jgi:hypothetical protein
VRIAHRYGEWVLDIMNVVRSLAAEGWTITADQLGPELLQLRRAAK